MIDFHFGLREIDKNIYLTIYTNIISDNILAHIDIIGLDNVLFHYIDRSDLYININCSIDKWNKFIENIKCLKFYGILSDKYNKFDSKYLKCALKLTHLHLGSSTYDMFENDDENILPNINLYVNGFGLVKQSDVMKKWITNLLENKMQYIFLC